MRRTQLPFDTTPAGGPLSELVTPHARADTAGGVKSHIVSCGLTKKAEPPPTRDVNRASETDRAKGGWLRRLVGIGLLLLRNIVNILLRAFRNTLNLPGLRHTHTDCFRSGCGLLAFRACRRRCRQAINHINRFGAVRLRPYSQLAKLQLG